MNIVPEAFAVAVTIQAKLALTPISIAMFISLAFCIAVVWLYCKRKM